MEFLVYHGGDVGRALADYRQRFGSDPHVIVAHPKAQIESPGSIAVTRNGGCLIWEIWLPMPEATQQQPMLFEVVGHAKN